MTGRGLPRSRVVQIALGLFALALAAFYWRDFGHGKPTQTSLPPAPLARGQGAQVMRIERLPGALGDSAGGAAIAIVLERGDPFWRIRAPIDDLASSQTVAELLRAVEELRVERHLEQGDPADFGLAPPRHRLVLSGRGRHSIEIEIGDYTSSGLEVYARWTGLAGIAIVPRYLKTRFLDSDLAPWRETELLPPRAAAIDSVTIATPTGLVRLRRLDYKVWRFVEPADIEADGEACERAGAAFWRFPFTAFVDDPRQWGGLGLDPPQAVWIVYRGGDADTLLIGARLGDGKMAVRLQGRAPGIASDEACGLLTGGIAVLEARGLFRGKIRDQRIVVILGEGTGRAYLLRSGSWVMRDLAPAETQLAAAGQFPDTARAAWSVTTDPAVAGDLANLLEAWGENWADPLAKPADPARDSAPWAIHLWSASGAHEWTLLYPDDPTALRPMAKPDAVPPSGPPAFVGRAVGSAQPARPMLIRSTAVFNWQRRLLRSLPERQAQPR